MFKPKSIFKTSWQKLKILLPTVAKSSIFLKNENRSDEGEVEGGVSSDAFTDDEFSRSDQDVDELGGTKIVFKFLIWY